MAEEARSSASWDPAHLAHNKKAEADDAARFVAKLSAEWQKDHERNARKTEEQLLANRQQASPEERLLLKMAAHDTTLAELLGECEVQLAKRIQVLIDDVATVLKVTRTLKQVITCRTATAQRARETMLAANVLRGQRRLSETPHLRRVA